MTHSDAVLVAALLFIIAIEVTEINLRAQNVRWPTLCAVIGVVVGMTCFVLAFKWI